MSAADLVFWGAMAVLAVLIGLASVRLNRATKIPTWVWAVALCALTAAGLHYAGVIA